MKKITVLLMAICLATSCSEFDDSDIWDKLNDHEYRIAYLEEVCNKMNADIVNLQTIVTALETNDNIVNASPLQDGCGYVLIFKSGKSIIINHGKDGVDGTNGKDGADGKDGVDGTNGKDGADGKDGVDGTNGKDGADGKDGVTPNISVMKDVDGIYIWEYDVVEKSYKKIARNGSSTTIYKIDMTDDNILYVPRKSMELYRTAPLWEIFTNIRAVEDME